MKPRTRIRITDARAGKYWNCLGYTVAFIGNGRWRIKLDGEPEMSFHTDEFCAVDPEPEKPKLQDDCDAYDGFLC